MEILRGYFQPGVPYTIKRKVWGGGEALPEIVIIEHFLSWQRKQFT